MLRLKIAIAISTLGLLTLTACGGEVKDTVDKASSGVSETAAGVKDKVAETTEGAKDKVAETTEGAQGKIASLTELPAGIAAMSTSAKTALDAVKSGDFNTAKAEATKLKNSWVSISALVKEKSPDNYTKIEESVTAFSSGVEGQTPDAEALKTTLTGLASNLKNVL